MALTFQGYRNFGTYKGNGTINMSASNAFKVALVIGYTFNAAHDAYSDISPNEYGNANGYTTGGKTLTSTTWGYDSGQNKTAFKAADLSWTAAGGDLGPVSGAVIYHVASGKLCGYMDFGQNLTAGNTTDFKIAFGADGVFTETI